MEVKKLLDNLNKGMEQYHDDVEAMTDRELWEHCFADGDIKEDDFCVQELKKRFLYWNFTDTEKANQFLLDEGYSQSEIKAITDSILEKVKSKMHEQQGKQQRDRDFFRQNDETNYKAEL